MMLVEGSVQFVLYCVDVFTVRRNGNNFSFRHRSRVGNKNLLVRRIRARLEDIVHIFILVEEETPHVRKGECRARGQGLVENENVGV